MGKQSKPPQNYTGAPEQGGGFFGGLGRAVNTGLNMNATALSGGANALYGLNSSGMDLLTGAPKTPDYQNVADAQAAASAANVNAQTGANRPDQSTPFASSGWTQGPDGRWYQSTSLNGGLNTALTGLLNQSASLGQGMDWSQFGRLDDGSAARDQAINASYAQATSRLNPQFAQAAQLQSSSLANAGLDPNSAAARSSNLQFQQGRNDAYSSAMNNAIHDGTAAQTATFNQNLMARQQAIAEALRKREQPMDELQRLQGLTSMPGFNAAGLPESPQALAAAIASGQFDLSKWGAQMGLASDTIGGAGELGGALAKLLPLLMAA